MNKSYQGMPIFFKDKKNKGKQLVRIRLEEKQINEGWIQDWLISHPELIPLQEIEPGIADKIIPIGKEISTSAGSIDNLYITDTGIPVIVETKLWRNPQARRQVVGQILDYANCISQWNYEKLIEESNKSFKKFKEKFKHDDFLEAVKGNWGRSNYNHEKFIDQISRNLAEGRIFLLIIGDGIRQEAKELANYINRYAHLRFKLALIELELFSFAENPRDIYPLLIVPNISAETEAIEHISLKVEYEGSQQPKVTIVDQKIEKPRAISEEILLESLSQMDKSGQMASVAKNLLSRFRELGLALEPKKGSIAVKMLSPKDGTPLSFLVLQQDGGIYHYSPWIWEQLKRQFNNEKLAASISKKALEIFGKFLRHRTKEQVTGKLFDLSGKEESFILAVEDVLKIIKQKYNRTE